MRKVGLFLIILAMVSGNSFAATTCFSSSIKDPSPFMGMSDDIFTITDGTMYKVGIGQYNYLYSYYPSVKICTDGNMIIGSKTIPVSIYGATNTTPVLTTPQPVSVDPCSNSSVKGMYNVQFEGVKTGNTIAGTYRMNFDGNGNIIYFGGYDSVNSIGKGKNKEGSEFRGNDGATYSVDTLNCTLTMALTLPDGTVLRPSVRLDQLSNVKPFFAYHGTGFLYAYNTPMSFNMTYIFNSF